MFSMWHVAGIAGVTNLKVPQSAPLLPDRRKMQQLWKGIFTPQHGAASDSHLTLDPGRLTQDSAVDETLAVLLPWHSLKCVAPIVSLKTQKSTSSGVQMQNRFSSSDNSLTPNLILKRVRVNPKRQTEKARLSARLRQQLMLCMIEVVGQSDKLMGRKGQTNSSWQCPNDIDLLKVD